MGYAAILLDAVVVTLPRASSSATHFQIEFVQADGSRERLHVIVPPWNVDLENVTRYSRVLIGGQLRAGARPQVVAGRSTILWLADGEAHERTSRRVHGVEAHWRLLASGKRVRVRAHVRGRLGVARSVQRLVVGASRKSPETRLAVASGGHLLERDDV